MRPHRLLFERHGKPRPHDRTWHRTATLHGTALPRGPQNALEGPQPYQVARIPTDTMVVFRSSLKAVCTSA